MISGERLTGRRVEYSDGAMRASSFHSSRYDKLPTGRHRASAGFFYATCETILTTSFEIDWFYTTDYANTTVLFLGEFFWGRGARSDSSPWRPHYNRQ